MKFFWVSFLLSFFTAAGSHAQIPYVGDVGEIEAALATDIELPTDLELREETAPRVKVTSKNGRLNISIKDRNYSVVEYPTAEMISNMVSFGRLPGLDGFNSLSQTEKDSFMRVRKGWLSAIAQALHLGRGLATTGVLIGDRVTWMVLPSRANDVYLKGAELLAARDKVIQNLLTFVDQHLWFQAPNFIRNNEFALELSLGVFGQTGKGQKGLGGVLEYGFSFAYNVEKKAFVFEIFSKNQKLLDAKYPFLAAGARLKLGVAAFSVREAADHRPTKPGMTASMPFSSGYTEWSPNYFAVGRKFQLGLPYVSEIFFYENELTRETLMRVQLRAPPPVVGFVAFIMRTLNHATASMRGRRCNQVFL